MEAEVKMRKYEFDIDTKSDMLTANAYQKMSATTIRDDLSKKENEEHALRGLASECGEVNGEYQKVYQGHPLDTEKVKKELGDVLWMVCELCTINGWKLSDVMWMNVEKRKNRYPHGFDPERSVNREV